MRSALYGACGGDAANLLKTREAATQFLERLREKYPDGEPKRKGKRKVKRRSFYGAATHINSREKVADMNHPPKSF